MTLRQTARLSLLLVALLSILPARAFAANVSYRPGEVLIQFRPSATPAERAAILADLGAEEVRPLAGIDGSRVRITHFTVDEAVARYQDNPGVAFVEPNYIYAASEIPNDPRFADLWGLRNTGQNGGKPGSDIDATAAWNVSTGSGSVLVAIIDTGVDYNHPDLAANIYVNPGEIPGNNIDDDKNGFVDDVHGWDFVNGDNNPMDDHYHGTHVAGTIGALGNNGLGVAGVNWNVRILPIKFLDSSGYGSTEAAIAAVNYATLMGVKVMNASWGGGGASAALRLAIQNAGNAGILFVAAAGNDGSNNDLNPTYPSGYDLPNIVAVAATTNQDDLATFSNYGATTVDLGAPGVNIESTKPAASYGYLSGTSMATPHVSGALALVFARFPGISGADAKSLLLASVDPVAALNGKVLSGGRLNAYLPIAEPDSVPPAPVLDLAAADPNGSRVTLRWTASGDDGAAGVAAYYDVRYSKSPIGAFNFAAATPAAGEPDPLPAGSAEEMTVTGLDFQTVYYFALKVADDRGNASPVSNVVSATTLEPPDIAVSPASLEADLLTGASTTRILDISNSGAGELVLTTHVEGTTAAATSLVMRTRVRPTRTGGAGPAAPVPPPGPPATVAYTDGHPPSQPVPAPASVTRPALTAAGGVSVLILHAGGEVTELRNQLLGFPDITTVDAIDGRSLTPTLDMLLPYDAVLVGASYPFGDPVEIGNVLADYADRGGAVILTLASFISGWEILGRFGTEQYSPFLAGTGPIGSSTLGTFDPNHPIMAGVTQAFGDVLGAVILSPGATQVGQWNNGQPFVATKGNNVVAINIFVAAPGYWSGDIPLVLRNSIVWGSQFAGWLSAGPDSLTVPPNTTGQVLVTFNAAGMPGGNYDGSVVIESNDPDESRIAVPAHLHVTGAPDIELSPAATDFDTVFIGVSGTRAIHVTNAGTDLLSVTGLAPSHPQFSAAPAVFTVDPGETKDILVTFTPDAVGSLAGSLAISSNDPDEAQVVAGLAGIGVIAPNVATSPDSLSADLNTGETAARTLTLLNTGGSNLYYELATQSRETPAALSAEPAADRTAKAISYRPEHQPGEPRPAAGGGSGILPVLERRLALLAPRTSVFFDDMENGANGWTRQVMGSDDLWHQTTRSFNSPGHSWWCGVEGSGTYDTGNQVNTAVVSPPIDLRHAETPITLEFYESYDTELNWDFCMVDVSLDGGTSWIPLRGGMGVAPSGDSNGWKFTLLDLSAFAGHMVQIRFYFNTGDNLANWYPGWFFDDVLVAVSGVPWLRFSPAKGTVAAGLTQDIEVTFDAAGLMGDDYDGFVVVQSNDPDEATHRVPAHLHVTGAPDIALSRTRVDFGQVWIGYSGAETLLVRNKGTTDLYLSGLAVGGTSFGVPLAGQTIPPGQSRALVLTFTPAAAGPVTDGLTITSNDPDEAQLVVELAGEGRVAPDIAVSPDSVSADLLTGQTATRVLAINNVSGSDLTFRVKVQADPATSRVAARPATSRRPAPAGAAPRPDETAGGLKVPAPAEPGAVSSIAFEDDFEDGTFNKWSVAESPAGKEVTSATAAAGTMFSFHRFNASGGHFEGIYKVMGQVKPGYIGFYIRTASTVSSTAYHVITNASGDEVIWFFARSSGFLYVNKDVGGDESFPYSVNTWYHIEFRNINFTSHTFDYYVDGALIKPAISFRNPASTQAFYRLDIYNFTTGSEAWWDQVLIADEPPPTWLTASPLEGVVPAGQTAQIQVGFNAAHLMGGDYTGWLLVDSNDPDESRVIVPAGLHVTGVPDIAASVDSLDFGTIYVGAMLERQFVISNKGTAGLVVSGFTTPSPQFVVEPASLALDPGGSAQVRVTWHPTDIGPVSGALVIGSNDPDEPALAVVLAGAAVAAPDIAVSPDSLHVHVTDGQTARRHLTITNTGGAELSYAIGTRPRAAVDPTRVTLFSDDMEQGLNGWTKQVMGGSPDLWHQSRRSFHSPVKSWWCGDEAKGTYDTGQRIATAAVSPPIDLHGALTPITLDFQERYVTEPGWDFCMVDVSVDGGSTWQPLRGGLGQAPSGNSAGWQPAQLDLSPYVDREVLIRFYFDTIDGFANDMSGWFFDDVLVTGAGLPWLSLDPAEGAVPAGAAGEIEASFDPGSLAHGSYFGSVVVTSNDPDEGEVSLPVTLTVGGPSHITLSANALDFGVVFTGATQVETLLVGNTGSGDLDVTRLNSDSPLFAALPREFSVAAGAARPVVVSFSPDQPGSFTATLTIESNDPGQPAVTVALTGESVIHVPASLTIRPVKLNLFGRGGVVVGIIELPGERSPEQIVLPSVRLNGVPVTGTAEIGDVNQNGVPDLTAYFDRQALLATLPEADDPPVALRGDLTDGAVFTAGAIVQVIRHHVQTPNGGEMLAGGTPVVIAWDVPDDWTPDHALIEYSADAGAGWTRVADGIRADRYTWAVPLVPTNRGRVRVTLYDRLGRIGSDSSDRDFTIQVSAADAGDRPPVETLALNQNTPNPFHPSTRINFRLPAAVDARLVIYDAAGRRVRVLLDRPLTRGPHEITWDGTDDGGRPVSAGLYIYKLDAGGTSLSRRMVLMK